MQCNAIEYLDSRGAFLHFVGTGILESVMSQTYRVDGMSCGKCAASVEKSIKSSAPKAEVKVDLEAKTVSVSGCDDEALLVNAIEDAGFTFVGKA